MYKPHFVGSFICQWTLWSFHPFTFVNNAAVNGDSYNICLSPFSVFWSIYQEVRLLNHVVILCLIFCRTAKLFFTVAVLYPH
jgi:hypothetical protein